LKEWKTEIFGALSLIFLAGLVTGVVVTSLYDKHRYESLHQGDYPAAIRKVIMETLTKELSLNTGQQREIEAIVQETQSGLKELRKKYGPEAETLIAQGVVKMKDQLTAEQQARFDQLQAKAKQRRSLKANE
jgi:hypothetical protein